MASAFVEIRFLSDAAQTAIDRYLSRDRPDYVQPSDLEGLLLELNDPQITPEDGFEAILSFFQADDCLLVAYDDLDFLCSHTAPLLLADFASRLEEDVVIERLVELLSSDPYDVRIQENRSGSEAAHLEEPFRTI